MVDWSDPLVQIKATSVICSSVAIVSTIQRLYLRWGRLWVDDAWAFLSMLALLVQIAAVFLRVPVTTRMSQSNRIASYYLIAITFYVVIWTARISILYSIIRIHPNLNRRRQLFGISVIYLMVCIMLLAQLFWVCEPELGWKTTTNPQCPLDKQIAVSQLVSDVIADLILIIAPLKLLWSLDDKCLRIRLTVIFSTCIATTIVSLVHVAFILTTGGNKDLIAALVEDNVSLIVCNIPVVISACLRRQSNCAPTTLTDMGFASGFFSTKFFSETDTAINLPECPGSSDPNCCTDSPQYLGRGKSGAVKVATSEYTVIHVVGK